MHLTDLSFRLLGMTGNVLRYDFIIGDLLILVLCATSRKVVVLVAIFSRRSRTF